jgi:hypothetical protein
MQSTDAKTRDMPARLEMIGGATREAELAIMNQLPFTGKDERRRTRTRTTGRAYAVFMQPRCVPAPHSRALAKQSDGQKQKRLFAILTPYSMRNSLTKKQFQKINAITPSFAKSQKRRRRIFTASQTKKH